MESFDGGEHRDRIIITVNSLAAPDEHVDWDTEGAQDHPAPTPRSSSLTQRESHPEPNRFSDIEVMDCAPRKGAKLSSLPVGPESKL